MKFFVTAFCAVLLIGCTHVKTLSGDYQKTAYSFKTQKSFDQVWSAIIDAFATNGIAITTADKSNGLILSTPYSISDAKKWTYESKGSIQNPTSWVVIPKTYQLHPKSIMAQFNVRVKQSGSGSEVSLHVVNIEAISDKPRSKWERYDARSTGVFEKMIAAQISK